MKQRPDKRTFGERILYGRRPGPRRARAREEKATKDPIRKPRWKSKKASKEKK